MNSTAFKPIFLHGALVAIGLAAATCGNYLTNFGPTAVESRENQAEQNSNSDIDAARQARSEKTPESRAPRAAKEVANAGHAS